MIFRWLHSKSLIRFVLIGGINTALGVALIYFFYALCGLSYWLSTATAYVLASIFSYFANAIFTFRNKHRTVRQIFFFAANIACCYLLAYGLAKPLVKWLLRFPDEQMQEKTALLFGMVLFAGFNYIGQRLYVFPNRKKEDAPP